MADSPDSEGSEKFFFPERDFTPRKGRITKDGKFIHERIHNPSTLRKRGYTRVRTVSSNKHRITLYFKGNQSIVQSKLHPISELHREHEPIRDNLPMRFR